MLRAVVLEATQASTAFSSRFPKRTERSLASIGQDAGILATAE